MPDSFFTSNKPRKRKRTESSSLKGSSKIQKARHTPKSGSVVGHTKSKRLDEDLDSDQTSDAGDGDLRVPSDVEEDQEAEDDPDETPAQKRLRLAQLYVDGVKEDLAANQGDFDAAEIDKELISSRLRGAQYRGKVHLFVADEFTGASSSQLRVKGHRLSCTAAVASPVASPTGYHLFTAGKEGHIFKWDLQNGKKLGAMYKVKPEKGKAKGKGKATPTTGHTSSITSLALTTDGTYLASGSLDSRAGLWDARGCRWISGFAHKDSVSSLSFRTNTNSASASSSAHTLYTASFDRTVKLWTLPSAASLTSPSESNSKDPSTSPQNMGYIETLFGHQDQILALDCLPSLPTLPPISSLSLIRRPSSLSNSSNPLLPAPAASKTSAYSRHALSTPAETLLTVGARDKTVRFWKVPEETQLVFRGGGATSSAASGEEIARKKDKVRDVLEGRMDALASDNDDSDEEKGKGQGKQKKKDDYRYIEGSLESVAMIDENTFLTGGDSGSICLWSTSKKKPIFTLGLAHGIYDPLEKEGEDENGDNEEIRIPPHPRWITALASLRYSNLFASGSYDGFIRLWKLSATSKKNSESQLSTFSLLSTIPCAGVINSLQFVTPEENFWAGADWAFSEIRQLSATDSNSLTNVNGTSKKRNPDARPLLLIASVGQEHRFGRWVSVKRQMIEVSSMRPGIANGQDGDTLVNSVESNGVGASREAVEMKHIPVRNSAVVWALFPRGWGER